MKKNLFFRTLLFPAILILLVVSCKKESRHEYAEEGLSSVSKQITESKKTPESDLLKSVRQATSRFHSTTQAIMAGYQPSDECVSVPGLGGMGYHWVNPSLVDPVFDPLKPEAILYATGNGGNLKMVALEYIVVNTGQPAPMFGNQPFDIDGTPLPVPHWSLHVWLYANNPTGMFTPFNPNISCP